MEIKPTLYASKTSPFVRKVRIALLEKEIDTNIIYPDIWKNNSTGITEINPLNKIPILVYQDTVIYDSRVILEFIDSLTENHSIQLYPKDILSRAKVKTIEAEIEGALDVLAAVTMATKRIDSLITPKWIEWNIEKANRTILNLEKRCSNNSPYFNGNSFSILDIAVGTLLNYVSYRFSQKIQWEHNCIKLKNLYNTLSTRKSFMETIPVE